MLVYLYFYVCIKFEFKKEVCNNMFELNKIAARQMVIVETERTVRSSVTKYLTEIGRKQKRRKTCVLFNLFLFFAGGVLLKKH